MNDLRERVAAALGAGDVQVGNVVVVALSGGLDSVVLLHLLRFACPLEGVRVQAAHFDHGMRASSASDADWVRGLCRAWRVELHEARAEAAPPSEEAARSARYAFLGWVRARAGARWVLTAHHADDQAETVLFRALRGTGNAGLVGIPASREPGLWRPLLGFWREELDRYARAAGLSWRDDPTNRDLRFARNALRGRILPEIERLVAPGARRALVRLAQLAREDEAGWLSVLPMLMAPLDVTPVPGGLSFDRGAFLGLHGAVQARILRSIAAGLGVRVGQRATKLALDFAGAATSGRRLELGGAWALERELGRLVLREGLDVPRDMPLRIPDAGPGGGEAHLGGARIRVTWDPCGQAVAAAGERRQVELFDPDRLRFPLTVRAREPGDRIRLREGTKKVKKLFLERRIPAPLRARVPLVVDAGGAVLWIPEIARAEGALEGAGRGSLGIMIQ